MKSFVVLISFLALTSLALADQQDQNKKGRKHQEAQAVRRGGNNTATMQGAGGQHLYNHKNKNYGVQPRAVMQPRSFTAGGHAEVGANIHSRKFAKTHQETLQGQNFQNRHFQRRHFDLASRPNRNIPNVTFRAGNQIHGSDHWRGERYAAFRNYRSEWHDRDWWHHHHHRIVNVFGGWYYWDGGYYYPAWGYAPDAYYAYDGPIYTGNEDVDPGQVVANVQAALQEQGYYTGEVDGVLGPLTRAALAQYQQSQGMEPTGAIDEPTLASLGMA